MGRFPTNVAGTLVPFGRKLEEPIALAKEALWSVPVPDLVPSEHWPMVETRIRSGETSGGVWKREGSARGIALWERRGPLGVTVGLIYLRPAEVSARGYRSLLEAVAASAGPLAFVSSPLPGLTLAEEASTMRELGFAPFGRSEMTRPLSTPVGALAGSADRRVRPFRPEDEAVVAKIHEKAYQGRFDRYLFLEETDPTRDAESAVHGLVQGRWGPFRPEASMVVEEKGIPAGSDLVVDSPRGVLIADVATDPAFAGRGVGRSALEGTLRALKSAGAGLVRLAVTEGNRRAIALYERLGFVRSGGPSREWYHTGRIPVAPEAD